eukprot:UN4218
MNWADELEAEGCHEKFAMHYVEKLRKRGGSSCRTWASSRTATSFGTWAARTRRTRAARSCRAWAPGSSCRKWASIAVCRTWAASSCRTLAPSLCTTWARPRATWARASSPRAMRRSAAGVSTARAWAHRWTRMMSIGSARRRRLACSCVRPDGRAQLAGGRSLGEGSPGVEGAAHQDAVRVQERANAHGKKDGRHARWGLGGVWAFFRAA